ncbi:EamA family transporter [Embleya sp. NPDC050493]|uniref:EamA family transporter n=1 Tax=Embleya sp. NPDC050493 TaxID=3363989 RepID=UPI00379D3B3A
MSAVTDRAPTPPSGRAVAANLAVVYVVFGSTYLAIRVMVETVPPLFGAGLRFVVAGALLYGWCAIRRRSPPRLDRRRLVGTGFIGLLVIGGGLGLLTLGEHSVPSGLAALLAAAVPVWVVLLRVAHGERIGWATAGGVACGLLGVAMLSLIGGTGGTAAVSGILFLLAAALSEAIGSYYAPRFSVVEDAILASAVQMLVAGPVLLVVGVAVGERPDVAEWSGRSVLSLLYLIGPGSILAYVSFVWLVSHTRTSIATTYTYVNPAVALFLGWLVLDESITVWVIVGAVVVVGGVVAVLIGERRAEVRAQDEEGGGEERDAEGGEAEGREPTGAGAEARGTKERDAEADPHSRSHGG